MSNQKYIEDFYIKNYLIFYLTTLFLLSVYFLRFKATLGHDFTISEWVINYSGGFTKRGIMGSISMFISDILQIHMRQSILYLQILSILFYYLFIYHFLKNIKFNRLMLFATFTPIFILYPVSEIEVLARKENLIYILFFIFINIELNFIKRFIAISLSLLIWEPVIFFLPFWFLIDLIKSNKKNNIKQILNMLSGYLPILILCPIFIFNPLTDQEYSNMVLNLTERDQYCGLSCSYLATKKSVMDQAQHIFLLSPEIILRYLFIIVAGFLPLFILLHYSKLRQKIFIFQFLNQNLFLIFFLLFLPLIPCMVFMSDWGRAVNISYVHMFISYFYLYKKKYIELDNSLKKHFIYKIKKKYFIFLFIIYAFSWAPKTAYAGDIGSFPGYRVPYKIIKSFI